MRHKHADLIIEWANGAKIQFESSDEWRDDPYPTWFPENNYRIKPEPKPDYVFYASLEVCPFGNGYVVKSTIWHDERIDKSLDVKVIFDGETGKPKSAEVLK